MIMRMCKLKNCAIYGDKNIIQFNFKLISKIKVKFYELTLNCTNSESLLECTLI